MDNHSLRPDRPFQHPLPGRPGRRLRIADEAAETELEIASALTFALRVREPYTHVVEHSARVTMLVDWIAPAVGLDSGEQEDLRRAARLHEMGMAAVPLELLLKRSPLSRQELERIRAQAWIGAEIARATHEPRTARLIENQYVDHSELRRRVPEGSRDLLLAGVLRVADVIDAILHPRPYQEPHPREYCLGVLRHGTGSKFHPGAVDPLLGEGALHCFESIGYA